jgi:hypothetical protein
MMITWKHDSRHTLWPPSFEQKVDLFYHRVLGWQLHVADLASNGGKTLADGAEPTAVSPLPHGGFAVLQICLSYFETIGQYLQKNPKTTKSGDFFKEGVHAVFPDLARHHQSQVDAFLDILYKNARCGLYHNSMTRAGVGLGQPGGGIAMAFVPNVKQLIIDPHVLPKVLKRHLEAYRQELLDPKNTDLRQKFETMFNKDNGL